MQLFRLVLFQRRQTNSGLKTLANQTTDIFILDSYVVIFFLTSGQHEAGTWDPNYTPGVDFLDHDFYNLRNSHQDLSNERSNFILSSLGVDHLVAQT